MITRAIERSFKKAKEKQWDRTFWAVDIHDTVMPANYHDTEIPTEFFPFAKEALQLISKRKDITLILYTCSYPDEVKKYLEIFKSHGIDFKYVNNNADVGNTAYGYYESKPYFNVLFEDKAGFCPSEWPDVMKMLEEYPDGYAMI